MTTTPPKPQPIRESPDRWVEVRCTACGRYLCSVRVPGAVQVKCKACKTMIIREVA